MAKDKNLRLLVVSAVIHYQHEGRLYAYGPYVREIDIWSDLFPSLIIAAPLRHEVPPNDSIPFSRSNISMSPQLETGGDSLAVKFLQVAVLPVHAWKLGWAMLRADAIHVRCPGNLGLIGALLAPLFSRRIVAKYAGQWYGADDAPRAFRWQRQILASSWWRNGLVTVYGEWPGQPKQIIPFFTSMMTAGQVSRSAEVASRKALGTPLRILYTGRLFAQKGLEVLLRASAALAAQGIPFELALVGDGPERERLEALTAELGIEKYVTFAGAVPYDQVMSWYEKAHILVLASHSEGWPKVLAEAMCHGMVCVATAQGLMPWMLEQRGITFPLGDADALAAAIAAIGRDPVRYERLSRHAAQWAQRYSLEGLRDALRVLLSEAWKVTLRDPDAPALTTSAAKNSTENEGAAIAPAR